RRLRARLQRHRRTHRGRRQARRAARRDRAVLLAQAQRGRAMTLTPVLTKRFGTGQPWKIENYERLDGYPGPRKAPTLQPDDLITLVKESNLRGRGGAGFPTGMKWSFIPQNDNKPHYVVVNGDEGEPGTCRDLPLMMNDPHALIEGVIIAC